MSGRITYGLSGISGNPNANFNIEIPNGNFTLQSDVVNPSLITTTSSVISTWDSGNTITVKTVDPTVELYTAEKCGFAQTSNSLVAIANGEVGLELKQNEIEIDRLQIASAIIRQYETISVASQNYNITAASPKTYLIQPATANTNKIIFNDANLNDGTTYSFYNMSNGPVIVESSIDNSISTDFFQTVISGHTGNNLTNIRRVVFLPNQQRIFTTANSQVIIKEWNYPNMTLVRDIGPSTGSVSTVSFALIISPDGTRIALGCNGPAYVTVFNTITAAQVYQITSTFTTDCTALRYTPDGNFLLGGTRNNIHVFNASDGTFVRTINAFSNNSFVDDMQITSNNQYVISTTNTVGSPVLVHNIADGTLFRTLGNVNALNSGYRMAITSDFQKIIVGGANGHVDVFNFTQSNQTPVFFNAHTSNLQNLKIDPTNTYLITGGDDNFVKVWRINDNSNTLVAQIFVVEPPSANMNGLDVITSNVNDMIIASGSTNGNIYIIKNVLANVTSSNVINSPGAKFYQNLTDYSLAIQSGTTSFNIPRFSACHIKVCKISNVEMYFFVNMTVNIN